MSIFEILGVWPLLKVFFEGIASVNWGDRGDRSLIYGTLSVLTVHFEGSCRYVSGLNDRYGIDQSCLVSIVTQARSRGGFVCLPTFALTQVRPIIKAMHKAFCQLPNVFLNILF